MRVLSLLMKTIQTCADAFATQAFAMAKLRLADAKDFPTKCYNETSVLETQSTRVYSEYEACEQIGPRSYPITCGGCGPFRCN